MGTIGIGATYHVPSSSRSTVRWDNLISGENRDASYENPNEPAEYVG